MVDATVFYVRGYYQAYVDVHNNMTYDSNRDAPHTIYWYGQIKGEKFMDINATSDYIAGYKDGWRDAQQNLFLVDC